ncbi:MAG: FHA domain-containing protein [Planctomycetota bacterium]
MLPGWRRKVWEAKTAVRDGRWDDAEQLLSRESVRGFLPAKKLSDELARRLVERCEEQLAAGDWVASLRSAERAVSLGLAAEALAGVRARQAEQAVAELRDHLMRGDTEAASRPIKRLRKHGLEPDRTAGWALVVDLIERARAAEEVGEASRAAGLLERAGRAVPVAGDPLAAEIDRRREALLQESEQLGRLTTDLHRAVSGERWSDVLRLAEEVLKSAPRHPQARKARDAAWRAVGVQATQAFPARARKLSTRGPRQASKQDTVSGMADPGRRMVAWIDSVGSYLLCLADEVDLGQPSGPGGAAVAIFGDLSRRHASIRREGESYVLKPVHKVSVDGQRIAGPTVLKHDSVIQLGDTVKLRFRKPHALSASAVLTFESHHKAEPAVDGVVLMAESCVIGPKPVSHVVCRGWSSDVVFFRRGDGVCCRGASGLLVDGEEAAGASEIADGTRIEGEDFALSIEELSSGRP